MIFYIYIFSSVKLCFCLNFFLPFFVCEKKTLIIIKSKNKKVRRFFAHFPNCTKIKILWRLLFEILSIHKPSPGSRCSTFSWLKTKGAYSTRLNMFSSSVKTRVSIKPCQNISNIIQVGEVGTHRVILF